MKLLANLTACHLPKADKPILLTQEENLEQEQCR